MPKLELFTCLQRVELEENSFILEQSVEGMDLAAGAKFRCTQLCCCCCLASVKAASLVWGLAEPAVQLGSSCTGRDF